MIKDFKLDTNYRDFMVNRTKTGQIIKGLQGKNSNRTKDVKRCREK